MCLATRWPVGRTSAGHLIKGPSGVTRPFSFTEGKGALRQVIQVSANYASMTGAVEVTCQEKCVSSKRISAERALLGNLVRGAIGAGFTRCIPDMLSCPAKLATMPSRTRNEKSAMLWSRFVMQRGDNHERYR